MEMGIGFVLKAAAALAILLALVAVPICSDGSDAAVPEYSAEITIDLGEPVTIDLPSPSTSMTTWRATGTTTAPTPSTAAPASYLPG